MYSLKYSLNVTITGLNRSRKCAHGLKRYVLAQHFLNPWLCGGTGAHMSNTMHPASAHNHGV